MSKKNYLTPFLVFLAISVVLSVALLVNFGSAVSEDEVVCEECSVCEPVPEEKALMYGALSSWSENLYDSSENLFLVDIHNFGFEEAKNVEVTCEVDIGDEDGYTVSEYPVTTVVKNIGNIASTSYKLVELESEKDSREGYYPLASCLITACDNCEILTERIPDYQDY